VSITWQWCKYFRSLVGNPYRWHLYGTLH
jgi:hypothetical protein